MACWLHGSVTQVILQRSLAALPAGSDVPWQRVINAKGEISARAWPASEEEQRMLLEAEGVTFDPRGRIPLDRYRWSPED